MVDLAQVRALAAAFPEAKDDSDAAGLAFSVGGKRFAWSFMERLNPKKPRVPRLDILAVRCPVAHKEMLIEAAPEIYFDDDHYRGYPAVLVRLAAIGEPELAELLKSAWRLQAPKRLA